MILGMLTRGGELRAWSVGCAGGEEPYTLSMIWSMWREENRPQAPLPEAPLEILATDISAACLARAHRRVYERGALRSVPPPIRERCFQELSGGEMELEEDYVRPVTLQQKDLLRDPWPDGPFDLILCRNLFFTYLEDPLRAEVGRALARRLRPGGLLMVGSNDRMEGLDWELSPAGGVFWFA